MKRIFLDTNVLISATMGHGLCADLFDIVVQDHRLILGEPVLDELERLLRAKFRVPAAVRRELLTGLRYEAEIVAASGELPVTSPDPDDERILLAAWCSRADWLVTGDRPLLALKHVGELPIVSPRQLWDFLEG